MKVHNLKIKPQYFKDVVSGIKTFEVRKNDRNFKVGDPKYCKKGYVILGFKLHLEMGGILQ